MVRIVFIYRFISFQRVYISQDVLIIEMMKIKIGDELRSFDKLSNSDIIELVRQSVESLRKAGQPIRLYEIPLGRGYFGNEECGWYLEYPKKIYYKPLANGGLPIVVKKLEFGTDEWNEYIEIFKKKEGN